MAWPEHPFVSALMVVRSSKERGSALQSLACFKAQTWPVKQLVVVNATGMALARKDKDILEIPAKIASLGELKNQALAAASGEWCLPWLTDAWYDPDYISFHMAGADRAAPAVVANPFVENGRLGLASIENAPFFSFFRLGRLPHYENTGSEFVFLKQLPPPRLIQQQKALAKRQVSENEFARVSLACVEHDASAKGAVCVVQLGRYGDLISILPLLLHIHNTYCKPYVVICREFAPLFDGVSYVEAFPVDLKDFQLNDGLALARFNFRHVIQTQIWGEGYTQEKFTDAYNREMWRMGGLLTRFEDKTWRSLFDQEGPNPSVDSLADGRPLIVVNLTQGMSSPFPEGPQMLKVIKERFDGYQVLDVGNLRLPHIYDMLPLIRKAKAVVSIDTSLLHLASATNTPIVALRNPAPWAGTVCRGVVAQALNYDEVRAAPERLVEATRQAVGAAKPRLPVAVLPHSAPARRVFHVVALYEEPSERERKRKAWARESWARLYKQGLVPAHYLNWVRWSQHRGAKSKLPYFKDLLQPALSQAGLKDVICYTNDDIILHPALPDALRFYCGVYGCVAGRRCEIALAPPPSLDDTPEQWAAVARNQMFHHEGRDLFAFTKQWIMDRWEEFPDFLIGCTDWDNCLVLMMRRDCGYVSDLDSMKRLIWPAEMPLGLTCHIRHCSLWHSPGNYFDSPANVYNRKLFRAWAEAHVPQFHFNDKNELTQ